MSGFYTGEETSSSAGGLLFGSREIVELTSGVRFSSGVFVLAEHTNPSADSFGSGFVVSSNDNDTDTSGTTPYDGVEYFLARRVKHTNDTDEGEVLLVCVELRGVAKVHVIRLHWVVSGGKSKATQGVSAGTVLASEVQDAVLQGRSERNLVGADASVCAPVQDAFRGALNEQFRSSAQFARFKRRAVRRHGFTVTRELQSEFLLPLGLQILPDNDSSVTPVQSTFGDAEGVDLLSEHDESSLGSLADLLERLFEFVEVNGGVVAHDANRTDLVEGLVVLSLDLLSPQEDVTDGLVGRSCDLELVEAAVVALYFVEDEHSADRHLVGSQSAGLVRADDGRATEGFDGWQRSHYGVLLGHTAGSQSQASRDYSWQTFGNGSHGKSDGDLEVVDGSLDPGSTVSGVVEVSDVDGPDGDADDGDDLRQLFTELVQLLLQGRLDLLGLGHLGTDLTNGGVQSGSNDDTTSFASGNVGTGEQDVFLVLEERIDPR